ncbi:Ubiquitin-conjugating enzyme E2 6 [Chytridiales sp. JEL 0842]|nr:Ubiquitin-conjugating enzyme E2 6 [Chytridiales sp. JEL 0842]
MATKQAIKRLTKEYLMIQSNPPPFITAKPLESNILEWHYVIRGPQGSPYENGEYHGKLVFPDAYPFKPPSIYMITPNGRFQTDYRLCLSMSDYHPGTWNPAWSVSTILTGLLSFMLEDTPTTGSIVTSTDEKRALSRKSHAWNLASAKFRAVFPELCTPEATPLPGTAAAKAAAAKASAASAGATSTDTELRHRSGAAAATTSSSDSSSTLTTETHQQQQQQQQQQNAVAHAGGARGINALVENVWVSIRSNMWRLALVGLVTYLLALKIMARLGSL